MGIYRGETSIFNQKLGNSLINKMYLGSTLVYNTQRPAYTPPGSPFVFFDPANPNGYDSSYLYDLSGNGNDGTLNGSPVVNAGYVPLNGTSQWVSMGDIGDPYGSFTMLAWVYFTSISGDQVISAKWTNTGDNRSWLMYNSNGSSIFYVDKTGTFGNVRNNQAFSQYSTGVWYLAGLTFDSTTGDLVMYNNNTSTATASYSTSGDLYDGTASVNIGYQEAAAPRYLNGRIGKYFLYKSVLSTTDRTSIWDDTKAEYGY